MLTVVIGRLSKQMLRIRLVRYGGFMVALSGCGGRDSLATGSDVRVATLRKIAAGGGHVCALLEDRSIVCWGDNEYGELGNGTTVSSTTPVKVQGMTDAVSVTTSIDHSCAARANGDAYCWGRNLGILGTGWPKTSDELVILLPQRVQGIDDVHSMATGRMGTCALKRDGSVWCWGQYKFTAIVADGSTTGSSEPTKLDFPQPAVSLSAVGMSYCVVLKDTAVWCWGMNSVGELGNGTRTDSPEPVQVIGLTGAIDVTAGGIESCALLRDGTVSCWGGEDTTSSDAGFTLSPVPVSGLSDVVELARSGSCARVKSGQVYCWGSNSTGQVGNGTTTNAPRPVAVPGTSNAMAMDSDGNTSCAMLKDGTMRCWGSNRGGTLGCGVERSRATPVSVFGVSGAVQVISDSQVSCALSHDGTVRCWGKSLSSRFDHDSLDELTEPMVLSEPGIVTEMSIGNPEMCLLKIDAKVQCQVTAWNYLPITSQSPIPEVTFTGKTPVQVVAVGMRPCALFTDGSVACWNSYSDPARTIGGSAPPSREPVPVEGLSDVAAMAADFNASFALRKDGTLWSWGTNNQYGILGNGTTEASATPGLISTRLGATAVACGYFTACAALSDGTVQCWGDSLEDGGQSSVPLDVEGLTNVTQVSVGSMFACARHGDGSLSCWGQNAAGQLGNGTFEASAIPVQVLGISTALGVAAGDDHSCALLQDETLRCWGSNYDGQLGNGAETGFSTLPVLVSWPK